MDNNVAALAQPTAGTLNSQAFYVETISFTYYLVCYCMPCLIDQGIYCFTFSAPKQSMPIHFTDVGQAVTPD